jgi:hypothetical protein
MARVVLVLVNLLVLLTRVMMAAHLLETVVRQDLAVAALALLVIHLLGVRVVLAALVYRRALLVRL